MYREKERVSGYIIPHLTITSIQVVIVFFYVRDRWLSGLNSADSCLGHHQ